MEDISKYLPTYEERVHQLVRDAVSKTPCSVAASQIIEESGKHFAASHSALVAALEGLLDGLDSNVDPERCGLSNEQWQRRITKARQALALPHPTPEAAEAKEPRDA